MTAIPSIAARDFEKFVNLTGTVACRVVGAGSWTLNLGDFEVPVREGFDARADLKLWFSEKSFEHFLEGKGSARTLVSGKQFVYDGDIGLLERIGFLLSPGQSPLAMRLAGF